MKWNYKDIISEHSSDIRLTHLEEMTIETKLKLPLVASKPNPLPLKHNFLKEEIENMLEAGVIERSMSPYATSIIVGPRKSNPGAPFSWNQKVSNRLLSIEQANLLSTNNSSKIKG